MKDVIPVPTLVLDDDERLARRLADWLIAESFPAEAFTELASACGRARATPAPRIALIDMRMPGIDGPAALRALREAAPRIELIALTAFPEPGENLRVREAGAAALLEKPIDAPRLLQAVTECATRLGFRGRTEAELNRRIGARLKTIRQARGRAQFEVAEQAGLAASQLSQIETGRTGTSNWTLARLCGALDISLDELLREA